MKPVAVWAVLVILLALSLAAPAAAEEIPSLKPVQVFDVKAGKVVRTVENDAEYQQIARGWLESVTRLSPQVKPEDKCGFVYRVPFNEPVPVRIGNDTFAVEDVFLFHCPNQAPLLLVFDANRRPYLLEFNADLKPFLRKIAAP